MRLVSIINQDLLYPTQRSAKILYEAGGRLNFVCFKQKLEIVKFVNEISPTIDNEDFKLSGSEMTV